MRRALVAALALLVALSCAAAARPAATFVLRGHGWGHGLGLAQYGAYGYAREDGRGYRWILDHYYPGTTVGPAGVARIRVLLVQGAGSLSIGSGAAFKVVDADGRRFTLSAGTHVLQPNMRIRTANGRRRTLVSPARFERGDALLRLGGARYRGALSVRRRSGRLAAVNSVGLEQYIRGVVAWEMPASWHSEALKAQAVIARTFGLVSRKRGTWFDVYDDTRSQVYGGVRAEDPRTNAAVRATRGEVVRSGGALAWTFYHSTSGGKTAARADEWGPPAVSYLVSVPDAHDRISPHHNWGPSDAEDDCPNAGRDCVWTAGALKRALGGRAPSSIRDFTVSARNGSSRVARVRLSGPPAAKSIGGGELRTLLGLRSTWFSIGVLRLTGGGAITKGERKVLHVLVRHLRGAKLQRKVGTGAWTDVRAVRGREDVRVRPAVTTLYRLRSRAAATGAVRVAVRSRPRFAATQRADALTGVAGPGEAVQVQRQGADGDWVTVAVALAQDNGAWRASLPVVPGTYRAYVASAAGVGTSPALTIAGA
jgi:stage II sporulation protein D